MRVRLFVDPTKATADEKKEGVIQDLEYVKALGKSIKDAGYKFMLDFHYSDTWTDPGNHKTPAAWSSMTVEELTAQINTYTETCLTALKEAGAEPDFIQTGNEITTGMLWNTGKVNSDGTDTSTGSMKNLAGYLASAIKACKKVCPEAKIVIHTELHAASSLPQFYQKLSAYTDVAYDIIGLSYYPDYHGTITNLGNLLTTLETNHADKQIMIVETGYGFEWALPDVKDAYKNQYPVSEDGQRQFAVALNTELKKHSKVNGLFWWYPEYTLNNIVFKDGSEDWDKNFTSGYWNAALFHYKTGKALAALYELKNFASGSDGIQNIKAEKATDDAWYSLDGQRMATKPATKGIFIHQGRKVINR
jgi:arabinogalactan endo-1,4-beta-galactosidase